MSLFLFFCENSFNCIKMTFSDGPSDLGPAGLGWRLLTLGLLARRPSDQLDNEQLLSPLIPLKPAGDLLSGSPADIRGLL